MFGDGNPGQLTAGQAEPNPSQQMHGALSGGIGTGASTMKASPYQILVDQLSGVIGRAEMINNTIDNVDRRLHGNRPEPEPAEVGQEKEIPNGYMEEVAYQMERLIRFIEQAERAANQLDQRVNI